MNEHDHFSNVLDVEAHEESMEADFDGAPASFAADEDDARPHEMRAPRKKRIPTLLLVVGGMVGFVVVGVGYNHFFGTHPQTVSATSMSGGASVDVGETPLPSGASPVQPAQGGLLAHATNAPPLPNRMPVAVSEPIGPIPSQSSGRDTFANASATPGGLTPVGASTSAQGASLDAMPAQSADSATASPSQPGRIAAMAAAASASALVPMSSAAPGSNVTDAAASSTEQNPVSATDPRDVEIARLRAELDALQAHGRSAGRKHHNAKHIRSARLASAHGQTADAVDGNATVQVAAGPNDISAEADGSNAGQAAAREASSSATAPRRTQGAANAAKRHRTRYAQGPKHAGAEVLVGYKIKQVIPGQGWVEDEQTGKQAVVAVGDAIGAAKVVRIDPDNYRIVTTAGVIQ